MNIAILYQTSAPPSVGGVKKPMKKGGYSDSGADIAFELHKNGRGVALPIPEPREQVDLDWVFGDDSIGIERALAAGADTLWLNTVLYDGHPIEKYLNRDIKVIGQRPHDVQLYDDKFYTDMLLFERGVSVIEPLLIQSAEEYIGHYPCVIKPVRGRGSQGVYVVHSKDELHRTVAHLLSERIYGIEFIVEPFLPGEEITVAVFPANGVHDRPYCLPPVIRFNHINDIAPYNGAVAVAENSYAAKNIEKYSSIIQNCIRAYEILELKAPIRIDCRQNIDGEYIIFDVNMKPNMTLGSRRHRKEQDSLVMLAAQQAGMSRMDLLKSFIDTAWS